MKDLIDQIKFDAICSRNLLIRKIKKLNYVYKLITYLTIALPIIYFIILSISINKEINLIINLVGIILTGVLLLLSIYALVEGIFEKRQAHLISIKNYAFIIDSCNEILHTNRKNKIKKKRLEWFFRYVSEISSQDNNLFGNIRDEDRKAAYRESLKEYNQNDTDVKCPICQASPWEYKQGSCIVCGNTPAA